MSHESTPEKTPEELQQIMATTFATAMSAEAGMILGAREEGATEITRGFLEANAQSIPPQQLDTLGEGLVQLEHARLERDGTEAEQAATTMRRMVDMSDVLTDILTVAEQTDPDKKVDSSYIAKLLREDVFPRLLAASESHELQSEVVMKRYRNKLTPQDRQWFPAHYQRVVSPQ